MPRTVDIDCPDHHVRETITLPDSYTDIFEGDIPCGAKDEKATLRIKLMGKGNSPRVAKLRVVNPSPKKPLDIRINVTDSKGEKIGEF
jgi:hypothetical protein